MFYADLHIHSKYSRATSRDADLEHLALWARRKGITVVGTGDFTHPEWFEEIRGKLVPAEPGLFRLRPEIEREIEQRLPPSCQGPVRFLLEVEISTIYKKGERTRKVHHLLYAAQIETAARIREKLGAIGNLASDGRPILGLDSRHLLEITLESGPDAYLIPAHVWTPWFAVLGSKSGFDSVEECYGDLAGHIFAVETGLSSDPPMNWRVSRLDRFTLVSNSDAHSPPMLGREASAFSTDLDYFAMRRALETGEGYGGTVEFFPEEGKYHLDGHRACGVRMEPEETRRIQGLCPACGKPLTVGVMHRVEELADRPEEAPRGGRSDPFRCLVPLPEVLSEIHGVGPKSRAVEEAFSRTVARLGPEIDILDRLPLEDVSRADPLLGEAVARLRAGKVRRDAGYDGEYGVIRVFEPDELRGRAVVAPLFEPHPPTPSPIAPPTSRDRGRRAEYDRDQVLPDLKPLGGPGDEVLDPEQRSAVECLDGPLLIVAGPGTGKTRTLTHRIAHLVADRGVPPEQCLAVTFSRRAAGEMEERFAALLPAAAGRLTVTTFHGLGLLLLREQAAAAGLPPGFRMATPEEQAAVVRERFSVTPSLAERLVKEIGCARRALTTDEHSAAYGEAMMRRGLLDFDDLLIRPIELFDERPDVAAAYRERFQWISIDEYQDIDPLQYALIRLLAPPDANLCAIGDPDQSIYSFRGADVGFFLRFQEDWPAARVVHLTRNYRSTRTLVAAACQAIRPASLVPDRELIAVHDGTAERIVVQRSAGERSQAELVVHTLERLLGGTSYFSIDSGRVESSQSAELSFDDVAILYRTEAQTEPLIEALGRAGIPFQKRSHRLLAEQPGVRALLPVLQRKASDAERITVEALMDRTVLELVTGESPERTSLLAAAELLRPLATRHGDDLGGFLSAVALGGEVDTWDPRAERVSLLTLHAAKGLEFPVVFIVGCEEGLLPLTWPGEKDDPARAAREAEERRLFFVGITRARSRLFLFYSGRPSPFLADLKTALLDQRTERETGPRRPEQLRLL